MSEITRDHSYDDTPYPPYSHFSTHPDRLAMLALLLGMTPAPVEQCRVLELGCAVGGNLIPMALALPNSRFVGVDNSAAQIEAARENAQAVGVENARFELADILDIDGDYGEFDYIIAHGVYSWVPQAVREKVLMICRENLAPQGVAYVSYNTYPGWHLLEPVRNMMLYRVREMDAPQERAEEGRKMVGFVTEMAARDEESAYGAFLKGYLEMRAEQVDEAGPQGDAALLHDELAGINQPFYFYEFIEQAAAQGLQYLAETDFSLSLPGNLQPEALQYLQNIARTAVEMEQYMDFLRNRTFRRTLLVHEDVSIERRIMPERMVNLYIASVAQPAGPDEGADNPAVERFETSDGSHFSTDHPLTKAAFHYLAAISPAAVAFKELVWAAAARLGIEQAAAEDVGALAAGLLRAFTYSMRLVELHAYRPPVTGEIGERPLVNAWARYQALINEKVTNPRHERVVLDGLARYIVPYMDGEHDQAALLAMLTELAEGGVISLKQDGERVEDPQALRALLADEVRQTLEWLARAGMLMG